MLKSRVCEMLDLVFLLDCYGNENGLGSNEIERN